MTTYYKGYEGTVKFNATGGTAAELTSVKNWTLSVTKELIKTTAYGDTAERFVGGLISGKGTIDLLYTGDNNSFIEAINSTGDSGVSVFELYLNKAGNKRIIFNGIIESATYGSSADEAQIISCGYVTNGAITMEI